ncbi:MAG: hypothetical protein WC262_02455 [Bacteroidales bacterium]|jgi:hypothetical protein
MEEIILILKQLIHNPESNLGFAMILAVLGMIVPFILMFLFPEET